MAEKELTIDFEALLKDVNADFPVYQALDEDGKIINENLVPELTDEELVELMTSMVWSRVLDQRSTALNRQGRLGFFAPTAGQEASQLASQFAFEKEDVLLPGYRGHADMLPETTILQIYRLYLLKSLSELNMYKLPVWH